MPFNIVRGDITKMHTDAIVNAANCSLKKGSGVCGAIFDAAASPMLQDECNAHGYCKTGEAIITKGYSLPAKYIIHTPGPVWRGGSDGEPELLRSCYTNSLKLAEEYGCLSIAFPLISAGVYGFPKYEAYREAISAISEYLKSSDLEVILVIYEQDAISFAPARYAHIEKYIHSSYTGFAMRSAAPAVPINNLTKKEKADNFNLSSCKIANEKQLEDILIKTEETFSEMLMRLIDEKGMTDVETYKRANIDRKLFSKIRTNLGYRPGKQTAIAFCIALRLNLDESLDLLGKAGYTLSNSYKFDLIIKYFIEQKNYDLYEINETLFAFEENLLV
ncbi:MAG: macro domain-containing protein [Clostridia bacterium]|nr:macro domain-containing protein [Clostridia bacterium]